MPRGQLAWRRKALGPCTCQGHRDQPGVAAALSQQQVALRGQKTLPRRPGDRPAGQGTDEQFRGQASGTLESRQLGQEELAEGRTSLLPLVPLSTPHPPGKAMIGRPSWGGRCGSGPPGYPDRCFNLLFEERLLRSSAAQTSVSV